MESVLKYLGVYFTSMFKFILGPLTAWLTGLEFFESFILCILGMMTSVLAFSFVGEELKKRVLSKYAQKKRTGLRKKINDWIQKNGVFGVAFLTPVIFSPILGTILASTLNKRKRTIYFSMLASAVFWSLTLNLMIFVLDIRLL